MTMCKRNATFSLLVAMTAMVLWNLSATAATVDLPDGSKLDTSADCPVCHMKVDSNPVGSAAVVFKDGKVVGFDGTADLFKYFLDPKKHGFDPANIKSVFVTDYGSKKFVDAKTSFFVVGSEVKGLMGPDPLAFGKKEDAEKFKADHKGQKVLAFGEVTIKDVESAKKKKLKMDHGHGG
ncbi:MAG: nitrous oxide reductase accessory protein NosL [Thermodesulfobacteriota bacterium]